MHTDNLTNQICELTVSLAEAKIHSLKSERAMEYKEDIVQDCVMYALGKKDEFGTIPDLIHFLKFKIPYKVKDLLRDYMGKEMYSLDEPVGESDDEEMTFVDTVEDTYDMESHMDAKFALEELREQLGWRDYQVLWLYHGYGYGAAEILEMHPELGIRNIKTIYKIINDNKHGE